MLTVLSAKLTMLLSMWLTTDTPTLLNTMHIIRTIIRNLTTTHSLKSTIVFNSIMMRASSMALTITTQSSTTIVNTFLPIRSSMLPTITNLMSPTLLSILMSRCILLMMLHSARGCTLTESTHFKLAPTTSMTITPPCITMTMQGTPHSTTISTKFLSLKMIS